MDVRTIFRNAPMHLRLLVVMRGAAIAAIALVVYCLDCILEIQVPLAPLAGLLALYALIDLATLARLAHSRPVGTRELLGQLLVDVAIITAVLYFAGGARNPLALYYLVLLLYGATALPRRAAWLLAAVCLSGYASLHFFYLALPLPASSGIGHAMEALQRFGIFAFIGALVVLFGVRVGEIQRLQREQARSEAEKDARERYLLGLSAVSAATAHELSTPLSTISLTLSELRDQDRPPPEWKEDVNLLWSQVQLCRRAIAGLAAAAGTERLGEVRSAAAGGLVADVAARLRAVRPEVALKVGVFVHDNVLLRSDDTLHQALLNFLNNAADVSPASVELRALQDRLNPLRLVIEVLDRGPGIAPELRERLGKSLVASKGPRKGHGAGVLIAQAAIERLGGRVAISDRRSGGTCVRIELPLFHSSSAKHLRAMR